MTRSEAECAKDLSCSEKTKARLAHALKAELKHKPLDKVTVSKLTQLTGMTRQGFYYHFADVNDLAVWVFERDIQEHIMRHASQAEWAHGLEQLLIYLKRHRQRTYAVIDSLTLEELEHFFFNAFREMMQAVVVDVETRAGVEVGSGLRDVDRDFIVDHYTLSVLGHLMHWLAIDMENDPVQLVAQIELIMRGNVLLSMERFRRNGTI